MQNIIKSKADAFISFINHPKPSYVFIFIIGLQTLLHLPFFGQPPVGQHTWRQVIGSSAARSFYEEDNNILYPKSDIRMSDDDSGYLYQEFPSLYWVVGQTFFLTGYHHHNIRVVTFLINILLLFAIYSFTQRIGFSKKRSLLMVFFVSCSPLYFYYSFNILPNMPGLMLYLFSLSFFIAAIDRRSLGWTFWLAVFCLTNAVLIKSTYMFFGLPLAWIFISKFLARKDYKIVLQAILGGGVVFIFWYAMYRHSVFIQQNAVFERGSTITLHPTPVTGGFLEFLRVIKIAFPKWFLEMVVNLAALPMFLAGLFVAVKTKFWNKPWGIFWVLYLLSFFIYALCFSALFEDHSYYLTSTLLMTGIASAYGAERLLSSKYRYFIIFLMILMPIVMFTRVDGRWKKDRQIPIELLEQVEEIRRFLPEGKRVVIAGDHNPAVFLYHIHRKGVRFNKIDSERLGYLKDHGFEYILAYTPRSDLIDIEPQITEIGRVGEFIIYKF